MDHAERFLRY